MYTFIDPNQANFVVTPDQYAKISLILRTDKEVVNLFLNGNQGSASLDGVEFKWAFDGVSNLLITISKVHSFTAKLFGNKKIFNILADRLAKGL